MVKGGVHGKGGHAWQRGGMISKGGACMAKGGMHGKGGHVWRRGACIAKGGMHGESGGMHGMHGRSLRGRYASYWNAFLST